MMVPVACKKKDNLFCIQSLYYQSEIRYLQAIRTVLKNDYVYVQNRNLYSISSRPSQNYQLLNKWFSIEFSSP